MHMIVEKTGYPMHLVLTKAKKGEKREKPGLSCDYGVSSRKVLFMNEKFSKLFKEYLEYECSALTSDMNMFQKNIVPLTDVCRWILEPLDLS